MYANDDNVTACSFGIIKSEDDSDIIWGEHVDPNAPSALEFNANIAITENYEK